MSSIVESTVTKEEIRAAKGVLMKLRGEALKSLANNELTTEEWEELSDLVAHRQAALADVATMLDEMLEDISEASEDV